MSRAHGQGRGKPNWWRRLLVLTLGLAVSLGLFELGARVWIQHATGKASPAEYLKLGANRTAVGGRPIQGDECTMAEMIRRHPFSGYVVGPPTIQRPCTHSLVVNERGTLGLDYEKSAEHFVIAIAGGSYAEQASTLYENSLQDWLNARFTPPRGTEFKVVSAANGGWHLPQQAFHSILYAERFDLVVHLFGLNEWARFSQQIPLEKVAAFHHLDFSPFVDSEHASLLNWLNLGLQFWTHRLTAQGPEQIESYGLALLIKVAQSELSKTSWAKEARERPERINTGAMPMEILSAPMDRQQAADKILAYVKKMSGALGAMQVETLHFLQPFAGIDPPASQAQQPWSYMEVYPTEEYRWFARDYLPREAPGLVRDLTPIFKDYPEPVYIDGVHHLFRNEGYVGMEVLHEAIGLEIKARLKLQARKKP
jgi:hypothetical protein